MKYKLTNEYYSAGLARRIRKYAGNGETATIEYSDEFDPWLQCDGPATTTIWRGRGGKGNVVCGAVTTEEMDLILGSER